ncbi:MAG: enoyl-CoA hydratase-related protein [Actinomycetes bacterium]
MIVDVYEHLTVTEPRPQVVQVTLDLSQRTGASVSTGLEGPAASLRSQEHIAAVMLRLRSIPQPVIAAVNGVAVGGGFALACSSDVRLAAESARFGVQFIKVGLSGCDVGVSDALPRLIGASRAFELMLTARMIDSAEADRIGFVSRVVADGTVVEAALDLEHRTQILASHSGDFVEAITAFMEKRPPRFGRAGSD